MSKAYDILNAIETLIDTSKSVINTVQTEYKPLNELIAEAKNTPTNFPKAIVIFGESEIPVVSEGVRQTIGRTVRYLLPIIIDIYSVKQSDLLQENDEALTEVRNLIDNDTKWTTNNFPTQYPLSLIERAAVFETTSQKSTIVFGVSSIRFNVLYWFNRGQS
jgi:hypothetical protein